MWEKIKSLKFSAGVDKLDGVGFGFLASCSNLKFKHPYRKVDVNQPSMIMMLRFLSWGFYIMVYKPGKIALNRAERRANHMK